MTSFTLVSYLLMTFFATVVYAMPTKVVRDDIQPPITYPAAGVVWTVGTIQKVTWDISAIPPADDAKTAEIILGWLDGTGENLQLDNPLAQIIMGDGEVSVTVPDVPLRDNYILCLYGSTGDITEPFTITGGQGFALSPSADPSTTSLSFTQASPSTAPILPSQTRPSIVPAPPLSSSNVSSESSSSVSSTPPSSATLSSTSLSGSSNTGTASATLASNNLLFPMVSIFLIACFA